MYIDTHCHLQEEYYKNIDDVILENRKAGIGKIIVSGCNKQEICEVLNYSEKYDDIYLTLGFHPDQAECVDEEDLKWLEAIINNSSKIVGIGEIGLDYHYDGYSKEKQVKLFEYQLKLAEKLSLPVVIHSRDATKDTINVLSKFNNVGVIHCFNDTLTSAEKYIRLGFKLGIGGIITFKNSSLRDVLNKLSLDNVVLETDSPYLTPVPYRGKINSSKYIPLIAEELSKGFNTSILNVENITTQNAYSVFELK